MKKILKLTTAEIFHLINLLDKNAYDGEYSGNRINYWNRANKIYNKLKNIADENVKNHKNYINPDIDSIE